MADICATCKAKVTVALSPNRKKILLDFPGEKRIVVDEDGICHIYDTFTSHLVTCEKRRG